MGKHLSVYLFAMSVILGVLVRPSRAFSSDRSLHATLGRSLSMTSTDAQMESSTPNNPASTRPTQARKRMSGIRQHVNPLSNEHQKPIVLESDWISKFFSKPNQPFVLDVGCAKGTWILENSKQFQDINYLGLEIRRPVVEFANERAAKRDLQNCHFLAMNVNVSIKRIMQDLKDAAIPIKQVCIHHPDPHFKKKHKKRKVVTDEFVDTLAEYMVSGAEVYLQSDIEVVCQDMTESFAESEHFQESNEHFIEKLDTNLSPHQVQTEREIATINKGLPVFRMLFHRK